MIIHLPCSCLPEVLNILGDGKWIKENPELIVAAMDLIRALWTGPPATLLRRSPNFWPSVLRPLLDKDVVRLMEDERLPEKRANLLRAKVGLRPQAEIWFLCGT